MSKVLFVISYLDKGGAERALSNITRNMPEEWEIDILVNSKKVVDYQYRGRIISMGIDDKPKTSSVFFQFRVLLKRLKWLKKLKRENGYKACVSFLDSANIANILSGNRYSKTIVSVRCSLKGQNSNPCYRYVVNPLVRFLYNHADKIVAVSRGIAKELIDEFHLSSDKVCAIENGYDINELITKAKEDINPRIEDFIRNKFVVVTSGRMSEQKGQWHLIRAFAEAIKKLPNAVLIIMGEGPLKRELKELVNEKEISNRVYFTGYMHNPYSILFRSNVFVMTSLYEGFPNAMAEAICLGVPCIATDFPTGARELLSPNIIGKEYDIHRIEYGEYGILIPCCSGKHLNSDLLEVEEEYLSKSIIDLCENKEMYEKYVEKSLERRVELGISNIVKQWIDMIEG